MSIKRHASDKIYYSHKMYCDIIKHFSTFVLFLFVISTADIKFDIIIIEIC